jgi:hypothetical protein
MALVAAPIPKGVKDYVKGQLTRALELNHYDTNGSFPATPTLQPQVMNIIPVANREGECVNMEKVRFSFFLEDGSATATYTAQARVIVFEWKALRLPTTADILETLGAAQIVNSPQRFTMRQFYRVLFDQKYSINPNCEVGPTVLREFNLRGVRKRFDDGVIPPQTLGLLYFLVVSDDLTVNAPTWNFNARVTYTDA